MPETLKHFADRHFTLLLAAIIGLLTVLAWLNRFIQDDAFISYRYAANFVEGNGLVWNPGERVEGYTNFLWTLLVSIPLFLKADPVRFSQAAGIACFILSLIVTYRLSLVFSVSRYQALLVVLILGTNYTFSEYATGGMETQLQVLLFTAATWLGLLIVDTRSTKLTLKHIAFSFVLSAALLTRLDSAIPAVVLLAAVFFAQARRGRPLKETAAFVLALLAPMIILIGGWLVWKYRYYGGIIPNTFYAKVSSSTSYGRGLFYVYAFLRAYLFVPFVFIALFGVADMVRKYRLRILVVLAILVLWLLYVIRVGGDFMEFRFLAPVLPLLAVFITELLFSYVRQRTVQTALVIMIFCGTLLHAVDAGKTLRGSDIERTRQLEGHLANPDENWIGIGRKLGDLFEGSDVIIATTAAGAIPYYSRLTTVDMFGLNDSWVARHGAIIGSRPGHQRGATLRYLIERKVNIIIGHPRVRPISQVTMPACSFESFFVQDARTEYFGEIPQNFKLIEIPIDDTYKLVAIYLFTNPAIDELIQQNRITVINLQYVSE